LNRDISEAVEVIRAGGVVGVPTDTVYGIGVDPNDEESVGRLYELKGRPSGRPIGVLVASVAQAALIGDLSGAAAELASRHWPGPLTVVVRSRVVLPEWVGDRHTRSVGIRVPDHPVALALLEVAGPLAVTSANLSGDQESLSDVEARKVFGDRVFYLTGTSPGGRASTVVDCTGDRPVLLRPGPVVLEWN
jgi:tRNA threonylcarbamoyl adenosine modification protein (Sua5/YciO/YrdC/YwlC family)